MENVPVGLVIGTEVAAVEDEEGSPFASDPNRLYDGVGGEVEDFIEMDGLMSDSEVGKVGKGGKNEDEGEPAPFPFLSRSDKVSLTSSAARLRFISGSSVFTTFPIREDREVLIDGLG